MVRWIKMFSIVVPLLLVCSHKAENPNRVVFLSIGQGNATLIQYQGYNVLVDGGPSDLILYKLDEYMGIGFYNRTLDLVILTHQHSDHAAGLIYTARHNEIALIALNTVCDREDSNSYTKSLLDGTGAVLADTDSTLIVGEIYIEFLMQNHISEDKICRESVNNQSLLFIIEVGSLNILFTGDAEKELEYRLITSVELKPIDIFQGGHHCSDTSNTEELLSVMKPELIVCSTGLNNRFNHPSKSVIERFIRLGIKHVNLANLGDYIVKLE